MMAATISAKLTFRMKMKLNMKKIIYCSTTLAVIVTLVQPAVLPQSSLAQVGPLSAVAKARSPAELEKLLRHTHARRGTGILRNRPANRSNQGGDTAAR